MMYVMIKIVLIIWLIGIHAFAFLAVWDTNLLYRIDRKFNLGLINPPESTQYYEAMLGSHLQLDGSVEAGSIIFLGDSLTQGLNVAAVSNRAINYGIGMDTTVGLLQRIPKYQSLNRASVIVIAIGVNDFIRAKRDPSQVFNQYVNLLNRLPNSATVIMQALFPVDEAFELSGTNKKIVQLNEMLTSVAKQRKFTFVNLQSLYADSQGNLTDALHIGDGIHLSTEGYQLWIQSLKRHL